MTLTKDARKALAEDAIYAGSPHHTDIPKFDIKAAPRAGAMTIEQADADAIRNPDCLVCPRKWARRGNKVTEVLRAAIKAGNFVSEGDGIMPSRLWVRDPDDPELIYEAKLSSPPKGYKAYPLTPFQAEYNIPFKMP